MECQNCGVKIVVLLQSLKETCSMSTIFDRSLWQTNFMNCDADFTAIYNHMIANNLARANMHNWRNDIGHNIFDNHQHIRFAVDKMWHILGICTWARVTSRYNPHMNVLETNQFKTTTDEYEVLLNQFTSSMAEEPSFFT